MLLREARGGVRGGRAGECAGVEAVLAILDSHRQTGERSGMCVPWLWRRRRLVGAAHVHCHCQAGLCSVRH